MSDSHNNGCDDDRDTGMSEVQVPQHVIDLSQYIALNKYTFYYGAHARLAGDYKVHSLTNVTSNNDPGLLAYIPSDHGGVGVR